MNITFIIKNFNVWSLIKDFIKGDITLEELKKIYKYYDIYNKFNDKKLSKEDILKIDLHELVVSLEFYNKYTKGKQININQFVIFVKSKSILNNDIIDAIVKKLLEKGTS